jgi:bifunctional lysine-specific demethylase and histidyl-hydroxylase NO66
MTDQNHPTGVAAASRHPESALRRATGLSVEDFARHYWARRPLLRSAAERGGRDFADLLNEAAVDELVSRRGLRTPFLRMAKEGNVIQPARFTRSGGAGAAIGDQAADDKILDLLAGGATLVLQALHRTWPPLVAFATRLSDELGHPTQINAYVTPPQNQGFAAHYDTHDVFVLQMTGRKRWRIHEPVVPDPLADQPWESVRTDVATRAAEPPLIDTELAPGDSLYLPRGYLHSAVAQGELSIHLTVGVHPMTRANIVSELLRIAKTRPQLRTSLPAGVDLADPDTLAPDLRATVDALVEMLRDGGDDVTASVAQRLGATLAADTRPEPIAPLAQAAAAGSLTSSTPLRLRGGLRVTLSAADDKVTVRVMDKTVSMPGNTESAVKWVLTGTEFTPAQLPGLDATEQMVLARHLLRDAIVVPS